MSAVAHGDTGPVAGLSKTVSGFLVAAARAQSFADKQDEEEHVRQLEQEKEDLEVEERRETVLQVNRALHTALRRRQAELQQMNENARDLELRLEGRNQEDPCRTARVAELQAELSGFQTETRTGQEARRLARRVVHMESKIEELNLENLSMSERHRSERLQLQENQSRLRTLGRRERELAKQLDFISAALNMRMQDASSRGESDQPTVDFRNLPGLRLDKLIDGLRQSAPSLAMARFNAEPQRMPEEQRSESPDTTPSPESRKSMPRVIPVSPQSEKRPSLVPGSPQSEKRPSLNAGSPRSRPSLVPVSPESAPASPAN